jgi:hypothetical protein
MNRHTDGWRWKWMAAVVLVHLLISLVHGAAHNAAHIQMSPAANLFVFVVILAGPLVGLAVSWPSKRLGSLIIGLTMSGSLVFGFVNHFLLESPDHVRHVEAQWRALFGTTAALLAITEMLGLGLAIRLARQRRS